MIHSDLNQALKKIMINTNIKMYFTADSYQLFSLNEASQQMISKVFGILNKPLENYTMSDPDYFFVVYNMFQDYTRKSEEICHYFHDQLSSINTTDISLIITIVCGALLLFSIFFIIIILTKIEKVIQEILNL